jgi:hypothetical protein
MSDLFKNLKFSLSKSLHVALRDTLRKEKLPKLNERYFVLTIHNQVVEWHFVPMTEGQI